jgi:hypothetical protein
MKTIAAQIRFIASNLEACGDGNKRNFGRRSESVCRKDPQIPLPSQYPFLSLSLILCLSLSLLAVSVSVSVSVCVCPSVRLSVRLSVCLSVYLSVYLSVCISLGGGPCLRWPDPCGPMAPLAPTLRL